MTLPYADRAVAAPEKVRDYLLAADHPSGRGKASFFGRLGFNREGWPQLQAALLALVQSEPAEPVTGNRFGDKYLVRGAIRGPTGRSARMVTVWIILRGESAPRLLTAYPERGK